MKLAINKKRLALNPDVFLRKAGYAHIHDSVTDHDSYVRRFSRDFYPRFHMYFKDLPDQIEFNLHLDQKKASYAGSHMHNAEYDSETVAEEINRLKGLLIGEAQNPSLSEAPLSGGENLEGKVDIGHGRIEDAPKIEKKGFWRKIFG